MEDSVLGISVSPKSDPMTTSDKFTFSEVLPLAGFLGADAAKDHDALSEIASYVRDGKKEFSDIDLLNEIRHIEVRLGAPKIGERRLDKVLRYVKLQSTARDVDRQLRDLVI